MPCLLQQAPFPPWPRACVRCDRECGSAFASTVLNPRLSICTYARALRTTHVVAVALIACPPRRYVEQGPGTSATGSDGETGPASPAPLRALVRPRTSLVADLETAVNKVLLRKESEPQVDVRSPEMLEFLFAVSQLLTHGLRVAVLKGYSSDFGVDVIVPAYLRYIEHGPLPPKVGCRHPTFLLPCRVAAVLHGGHSCGVVVAEDGT